MKNVIKDLIELLDELTRVKPDQMNDEIWMKVCKCIVLARNLQALIEELK